METHPPLTCWDSGSPKPHVEYRMEVFRDSVRSLIEELDLGGRPLFIVAHSPAAWWRFEYGRPPRSAHPEDGPVQPAAIPG